MGHVGGENHEKTWDNRLPGRDSLFSAPSLLFCWAGVPGQSCAPELRAGITRHSAAPELHASYAPEFTHQSYAPEQPSAKSSARARPRPPSGAGKRTPSRIPCPPGPSWAPAARGTVTILRGNTSGSASPPLGASGMWEVRAAPLPPLHAPSGPQTVARAPPLALRALPGRAGRPPRAARWWCCAVARLDLRAIT